MPCATPPRTWPSTTAGLMSEPQLLFDHLVARDLDDPGLRVDLDEADVGPAGKLAAARLVEQGDAARSSSSPSGGEGVYRRGQFPEREPRGRVALDADACLGK